MNGTDAATETMHRHCTPLQDVGRSIPPLDTPKLPRPPPPRKAVPLQMPPTTTTTRCNRSWFWRIPGTVSVVSQRMSWRLIPRAALFCTRPILFWQTSPCRIASTSPKIFWSGSSSPVRMQPDRQVPSPTVTINLF